MFFRKRRKGAAEGRGAAESSSEVASDVPEGEGFFGDAGGAETASGPPSTQFLTGEAGQDRRTVQVLLEAIAQVSGSRDLQSLLTDIVDRSIEITGAERGLLIMRSSKPASDEGEGEGGGEGSGGDGRLSVRVSRLRGGKPLSEDVRFSTSIANKVLDEVQAMRATVHSESEALELGRSVYDLKLRAVMCVPLASREGARAEGGPSGVLYVDSRAATRQFSQGDLALFAALAQHISIAMENARLHLDSLEKVRLEQSLELASTIQRDLMPDVPTDLPNWEVHGWYGPAEQTAGDFYDFVKVRDGRLAILVGDVTGHGIGPALITASAQAGLRSYLRLISDPGEVVSLLNQDLCERVEDGRFLTLFMAMLAADGSVNALNGGHALPFVFRKKDGSIETIGRGGPALGMIPDEKYEAHDPIQLETGDVLVIYTDGLTEARNPATPDELLGEEGVKEALASCASGGAGAKEVCMHLVELAMKLTGGVREDDITVVVARRQ